jgi:hypothetical protein
MPPRWELMMKLTKMISAIVAVGSVSLGGSLGAVVLEKANAAPLAGNVSVAGPSR